MKVTRGTEEAILAVNLILKKVAQEFFVLCFAGVGLSNPAGPFTPWVEGN